MNGLLFHNTEVEMECVFGLSHVPLQLFMESSVKALGWTYILLWSLDETASQGQLVCKDGWYHPCIAEPALGGFGLFGLYKQCHFHINAGIPGLAYTTSPLLWLSGSRLLLFSFAQTQERFYAEAGIQTAVFIPCRKGVIEMGTRDMVPAEQHCISLVYGHLASLLTTLTASPEIPSMVPATSSDISPAFTALDPQPKTQETASGLYLIRTPESLVQSAFFRWRTAPATLDFQKVKGSSGQLALKRCIGMVHNIHKEKRLQQISSLAATIGCSSSEASTTAASSSQIQHMISERKRRERIKESFENLQSFLPRTSKKDKTSVLENAKNYLMSLMTRIQELDSENQRLSSDLRDLNRSEEQNPEGESAEGCESPKVVISCFDDKLLVCIKMQRVQSSTVDVITQVLKHINGRRFPVMSVSASRPGPNGPFTFSASINLNKIVSEEVKRLKSDLKNELQSALRTLV